MNRVEQYLTGKLDERIKAGNMRRLTTQRAPVDFYSNDYMGLATTGLLASRMKTEHGAEATGSTGSRLLSGNSSMAAELEETIASFHHAEAALLFNSGYDANTGLLGCIASRHTTVLYDELCHASLIDGIRLSQCAHKYRFPHNDLEGLEARLRQFTAGGPVIVVVESVYSMDGDMAPLEVLAHLCGIYDAQLVVDEAHATGIFGPHGSGLVCALGLTDKVFARIHTFGKALGCHGAAVVGSDLLKKYLVNFARPFIYTTALPAHALVAVRCAYGYLSGPGFDNQPLHALIAWFRQRISENLAEEWKDSVSPIQALIIGSNDRCRALAAKMQAAGLQVSPILHPTVPAGQERLRICLHIFNTIDQAGQLFEVLRAIDAVQE